MKKKIILAVLTLIIIIGAVLLVTRSNKQEFISYIVRDDIWEVLEENYIEKYSEKQEETSYTNKGQISVTTNGLEAQTLGMIQDINWTFEGNTNKEEDLMEQEIVMNGENDSSIKFRRDNQKVGIKTEMLGSKFVAIENENLKALAEKFGFDSESIPDKIELENADVNVKVLKTLGNKYLKILSQHLTNDQFSKEKVEGQTVLSFNITEQKVVEIVKNILQKMREDEDILNSISEELKMQMQEEIDVILKDMDSLNINPDNKFIIKLYVKFNDIKKYEIIFAEGDKELSKTTIENTDTQITLTTYQDNNLILEGNIAKEKDKNDVNYNFSISAYIEGQKTEFALKVQYKNLLKLDNVEEILELKVSYEDQNQYGNLENTADKMEMNINYSNKKSFDNNLQIEGLDEENTIVLNTATDKELQSIIKSIFKNIDLF